ncbi:MAG TPA: hypothetical protein VFY63_17575 [Pseudorhizobium sp.]|nr:hypothetical protein [Pseudorhizobium sp.]
MVECHRPAEAAEAEVHEVRPIMTAPDPRDLSQLSALLASATTASPKPSPAPKKQKPAPVAANDNKAAPVLAWPALERLVHRGDDKRAYALRHWKNLVHPGSGYDDEPEGEDEPEKDIRIRPSEGALLRAVGWRVTGNERWEHTGKLVNVYERAEIATVSKRNRLGGIDARLGGLLFRDGRLVQWGETKKGRKLKPVEQPGEEKGGHSTERSEASIWRYIRTRADTPSPFAAKPYRRPFSAEPAIIDYYDPLPREEPSTNDKHGRFGVEEARKLLQAHGVDGAVPFDKLPIEGTLCPDGLVAGPQWVGGVKKPKPTGEISAPGGREPEFARVFECTDYLAHLRHLLGDHAKVLDLAITDTTAKDIGIAMGKAPAYAEKVGPLLIDAALDALMVIDETARLEIAPPVKKLAA